MPVLTYMYWHCKNSCQKVKYSSGVLRGQLKQQVQTPELAKTFYLTRTTFEQFIFIQSYPHLTTQDYTWTFTQQRRQEEPKFCPKLVATPKRAKPCQMELLYCHLGRQRLAKWLLSSFVDVCWLLWQLLPTQSDALSQRLCPVSGFSLWPLCFCVNIKCRTKMKNAKQK